MKHKTFDFVTFALAAFVPFGIIVGCNSKKKTETVFTTDGPFVQVERLGRPAVNEGLLISNEFLIAFNSIAPDQDLTVVSTNTAFATQVTTVLDAVDNAVGGAPGNVDNADVIQAFLPDVMRIDTTPTTAITPATPSAYATDAIAVGTVVRPVSGRMLTDDVIDTTLTVLAGGALGDGVGYNAGGAGGHALLNGQATLATDPATFPFLAPAN